MENNDRAHIELVVLYLRFLFRIGKNKIRSPNVHSSRRGTQTLEQRGLPGHWMVSIICYLPNQNV